MGMGNTTQTQRGKKKMNKYHPYASAAQLFQQEEQQKDGMQVLANTAGPTRRFPTQAKQSWRWC